MAAPKATGGGRRKMPQTKTSIKKAHRATPKSTGGKRKYRGTP